ncbi:MAG: peptide deformylase [Solirubrobacteraceae bacterium]|nr:peptide deformylase [Solirubrobacteraceae bacterium]
MSRPASSEPPPLSRREAFDEIVQWGDPVLRSQTSRVTEFDDALAGQAAAMIRIMDGAIGAGLAAPQIGSLRRLLVYRPAAGSPARALVNAEVVDASEETARGLEGCLSIGYAQIAVEVERPIRVTVKAQELDGTPVEIKAEAMHARVLQHEIDHLDGVLMLQRTDRDQRRDAIRALHAEEPYAPPSADPADIVVE